MNGKEEKQPWRSIGVTPMELDEMPEDMPILANLIEQMISLASFVKGNGGKAGKGQWGQQNQ